jgi:hypothetical protein
VPHSIHCNHAPSSIYRWAHHSAGPVEVILSCKVVTARIVDTFNERLNCTLMLQRKLWWTVHKNKKYILTVKHSTCSSFSSSKWNYVGHFTSVQLTAVVGSSKRAGALNHFALRVSSLLWILQSHKKFTGFHNSQACMKAMSGSRNNHILFRECMKGVQT